MRREVPLALTAVAGVVTILGVFVPHPLVGVPAAFLQQCAVIGLAFGYVLGGAHLLRVNLEAIASRQRDWPYKAVLVAGLVVVLVFGLVVDRARFQSPGTVSLWLYDHVFVPTSATVFSLLAFFVASAAFRAFRIRTLEAGVLAAAALVVMIGRVPAGDALARAVLDHPGVPEVVRTLRPSGLEQWLVDVPQGAARRAILIGAAMGVMATGLRVILGIERAALGEGE